MRIHNVNMAVPVGRPPASEREQLDAELTTEMQALRERCIQMIRQRGRFAFTERQRVLQQQQFEVEVKGIVKKLASAACVGISNRDMRTHARVKLYTDLSTIAQALTLEVELISARRRRRQQWLRAAVLLLNVAVGLVLYWWLAGLR